MRYIDLSIQTLLFLGVLISLIVATEFIEIYLLTLGFQFLMGVWQGGGSLIAQLLEGKQSSRQRHFTFSLVYLAIFFLFILVDDSFLFNDYEDPNASQARLILQWVEFFVLLAPPWMLAIYCYVITWRTTFGRFKKTTNFLPHINF
jgi:hypothetical protein